MDNYKESYLMLFNKITDLIEQMKEIQIEAEERWISAGEEKVIDFPKQVEQVGSKK